MDPNSSLPQAFGGLQMAGGPSCPKIQLSFSAKGLRNKDMLSKSDPMLVGYVTSVEGKREEFGRTEVKPNTNDPAWIQGLTINYKFEEVQQLMFVVYDADSDYTQKASEKLKLKKQDYLGEMHCILAEVLASPGQVLTRELQGSDTLSIRGSLTIRAEEVGNSKPLQLEILLRCSDLENQEYFSKSDPFLRFSRIQQDGMATAIFDTETINNNLNPKWDRIRRNIHPLCNSNLDRPVRIECFDHNSVGSHKLIGMVDVSINKLLQLKESHGSLDLTRPTSKSGASKCRGKLFVEECKVMPVYGFLDYVCGGCEINFLVAVDFTASNGDPWQPGSLHYIDPSGQFNAYQTAIHAVGGVLQHYDTDKQFPCFGFGGKPDRRTVSHCFPLSNTQVFGIQGILAVYSQAVQTVELYGPTLFAPVINTAAQIASSDPESKLKYYVLLIITDGEIIDLDDTVNAIVHASHYPISLLIVGVGSADFGAMEFLDSDKKRLTTRDGRKAERDIVQFVPIKSVDKIESAAKKLLKELPDQLVSYMKLRNIQPNLRPTSAAH